MNHRTGKLTAADFDRSRDVPAPTFPIGLIEHTSDFSQLEPGATFKQPAPKHNIFEIERKHPWLVLVYFALLFGTVLLCHWFAGGFA